ncbi:MAG: response regulator transcription factor [Rhodocyclaceae bacterium]|nr:response regulator transcription factor [Rhodocyclaceae bacterium]
MAIRVMLVDDHAILRQALRHVLELEGDIAVVAEASSAAEALLLARQVAPDVAIMDIGMPGMDGIETTRHLLAENNGIRVLTLSTYLDRRIIQRMLEAGSCGYVVKSAGSDDLLRGIREAALGRTYLSPEVAAIVVKSMQSRQPAGEPVGGQLGRREREVLTLLAEGNSSPEIAAKLHIATSTVEVHRRNIMRKLDLHSVAELTKYAIRHGLTAS